MTKNNDLEKPEILSEEDTRKPYISEDGVFHVPIKEGKHAGKYLTYKRGELSAPWVAIWTSMTPSEKIEHLERREQEETERRITDFENQQQDLIDKKIDVLNKEYKLKIENFKRNIENQTKIKNNLKKQKQLNTVNQKAIDPFVDTLADIVNYKKPETIIEKPIAIKEPELPIEKTIEQLAEKRLLEEQDKYDKFFGKGGIASLKRPI